MDDINERPVFTQEQIDKELKQIVLLDRVLAESGALTLGQLNDVVSKIDKVMISSLSFSSSRI